MQDLLTKIMMGFENQSVLCDGYFPEYYAILFEKLLDSFLLVFNKEKFELFRWISLVSYHMQTEIQFMEELILSE